MLFAICFNIVVFPAFGGATIIPLCPFPIGDKRSINLIVYSVEVVSSFNLFVGYIGVKSSKETLFIAFSGCCPFTSPTNINAGNFSPSFGVLFIPFNLSPVSNLNLLICTGETYTSLGVGK